MLKADGGGGSSGTDWNGRDVPQMWTVLSNQETDSHWKRVSAWRKTFELASMHLSTLQSYRGKLAEAWPPEKNAASSAYMKSLDYLINHVQQTYDAAVANYTAFSGATGALSTTRHDLKAIHDEYVANEAKLANWTTQMESYAKSPGAGKGGKGPPPQRPVGADRQQQLTLQARSLMFKLSGELTQARVQLRQPPPYNRGVSDPEGPSGTDGGGNAIVPTPPPIPPVSPSAGSAAASGSSVSGPSAAGAPIAATPAAGTPSIGTPSGAGVGPILGGATGPLPPAPGIINPGIPTPPMGGVPPTGVIGGPIVPPVMPPVKTATGLIGGVTPKPITTSNTGTLPVKPMPPGGLIGSPANTTMMGQQPGNRPIASARPVDGVIGQRPGTPASTVTGTGSGRPVGGSPMVGPAGSGPVPSPQGRSTAHHGPNAASARASAGAGGFLTGTGSQPFSAVPSGRQAAKQPHDEGEAGRHWDPDNPWETNEGVDPVVLPPREPGRTDPGPAIGFNR
ncbi:MAG TPA: hypothetical protein VES42_24130 [Pilimelia sp.]|nr:hypothetical protein [Pilimelia sp.]